MCRLLTVFVIIVLHIISLKFRQINSPPTPRFQKPIESVEDKLRSHHAATWRGSINIGGIQYMPISVRNVTAG